MSAGSHAEVTAVRPLTWESRGGSPAAILILASVLSVRRAIRAGAWALVAVGVAAPAVRRRVKLPKAVVLGAAAAAPPALVVAMPRSRVRDFGLCALNMWAYVAAYELPNDDHEALERRVHIDYPIAVERVLGLGEIPTIRLQRAWATDGEINGFERLLVFCHWIWFAVPHCAVAWVLLRTPERFPASAVRMYAVFDAGAVFYWAIPTAPPWYAARHGRFGAADAIPVRRMMIEYGERFWGERWPDLLSLLGGNPLAAMPSLHFATSLMAAHLLTDTGPVAGAVGWSYLGLLGIALVYLGEHYATDLIGGALLTETVRRVVPRIAPRAMRVVGALEGLHG
jgi:membrane-associated phospholipid phosphatase